MRTWISLLALGPWLALCAPSCQNFILPVTATASNLDLPIDLNLLALTSNQIANLANSPRKLVSGTYSISGTFCEPENSLSSRHNTLQILIHGLTYTKEYWSGLGPPGQGLNGTEYSWIYYASKQGYPTLAFDRICNGASSHPNGLLACQLPLDTAILIQIIHRAQIGTFGDRNFSTVIPIGHSEGSLICEYLAQTAPDIANTLILTGFTDRLLAVVPGALAVGDFVPAAIGDPSRYASLLDPDYLVSTSEHGVKSIFYFGSYTEDVAQFDYAHRGTVASGEVISVELGQTPAPEFTGSIFVLNGQEDEVFCTVNPTDPITGSKGQCGYGSDSFSAKAASLFPNAKSYQWHQTDQTGHCLNLHETAQQSFKTAHDYLAAKGY